MSTLRNRSALAAAMLVLISLAPLSLSAATAPDANLYISYSFGTGYQNVYWTVCGSTADSEGCYDSGSMGPFGKAGALIEGNPSVDASTSTVTRYVYIVDIAAGSGTDVALNVYKRTDVVTSSFDTTTITLEKNVPLTLTGGATAICSMAANSEYLFIGTDQSPFAIKVKKNTLATTTVGGFSPPENVTSITADKYGFVTVTFGGSFSGGFYTYDPTGALAEDGGGSEFMLNTSVALTTTNLPTSDAFPTTRLQVRPKKQQSQTAAQD
jgi:hypothetical protein